MRFRPLLPFLFLSLVAAKGGQKGKEEGAPAASPEPAPASQAEPAPAAPPAEAAPSAAPSPKNVSLGINVTFADGTTKNGKLTGIERTVDFNGDEGWTADEGKIKLTVENGNSEKQVAWKDVKSLTVVPGKIPDDIDCTYSSDVSPWMYECTLKTTVNAVLKDGSKGTVTNRHRWRFSYEDGSQIELSVYKYTVREPDDRELQFGDEATENTALYTRLQDKLRKDAKSVLVKAISVQ